MSVQNLPGPDNPNKRSEQPAVRSASFDNLTGFSMPSAINQLRNSVITFVAVAAAGCATTQPSATTQAPTATASPQTPTAGPSTTLSPAGYRPECGTAWTVDAPPRECWKRTSSGSAEQRWLDSARLAPVGLPNWSASVASANGPGLTNHQSSRQCTADVSPKDSNYIETGFAARN